MSLSPERVAHWKELARRQKVLNIAVFALLGLVVLGWFADHIAPDFSLPSGDHYVYVLIGIFELLIWYRPADIGWRNSRSHFVARLWSAMLEIKPVLRIATLVPFVLAVWCFAQTLTSEGFTRAWQNVGLHVGDIGWVLFYGLISPLYVSRSIALFPENSTDQRYYRKLMESLRVAWRFSAIAAALIGLNLWLSWLGERTFWREANLLYIVIFFFPIWLEEVKRRARATADKPAA